MRYRERMTMTVVRAMRTITEVSMTTEGFMEAARKSFMGRSFL